LDSFKDATCKPYYQCSLASICSDAGLNCDDCATFVRGYVTETDVCYTSDMTSYVEDECASHYQQDVADHTYAQCN
jgi:hypothetical protein